MPYKVIGIKKGSKFTSKEGQELTYNKIYVTYQDKYTTGLACKELSCPDKIIDDFEIGLTYELYYNMYRKLEMAKRVDNG